jgi:hypothetical protein
MGPTNGVVVEFFGIPRLRAGRAELRVPPGSVNDLLAAVQQQCPGLADLVQLDGRLAPHYLLSVNGYHFGTDLRQTLQPGDRLLVLSADAGG